MALPPPPPDGGTATAEALTEPLPLPLVDPGSATLSVYTPDNYYVPKSYNDNLPVYQKLEELTGVTIDWEAAPGSEYSTALQTRLAAAMNLPDIFCPSGTSASKLGADGLVIALDDLIPSNAYYLSTLFSMYDTVRKAVTSPDGHIYGYPGFGEGIITGAGDMKNGQRVDPGANINLHVSCIRKDWLDKLGLEVPTTLDEWYTVLKAFKEGDPNGNGKADEIPLSDGWGGGDWLRFGDAFGLYMAGNAYGDYEVGEDGKLFYKYIDERYKQTLEYLNKLYSEGLIDPEYATVSFDNTSQKISTNIVGAIASEWMSNIATFENNLKAGGVTDANWVPVMPPENPDGVSVTHNRWSIWTNAVISKDCENPELALQWLDIHCLSPEGIDLQMFGIEGETYEVVDGEYQYTDLVMNNPDGLGPFEVVRSVGGWCTGLPYIQTKDAYVAINEGNDENLDFCASFSGDQILDPFPSLQFTDEEQEMSAEISTNISTYVGEMRNKFIEGKEPLDNFDAYVEEVKNLGLDQLTEIWQTAYDRYLNS